MALEGERRMPIRGLTPVEILLVDDSPDDAEQMVEALHEGSLEVRVTIVEDGEEAIRYLHGHVHRRPDLILLDLHMPRKSGHEVLDEIKEDEQLRRIPIVVLTASDDERAFQDAYDKHANCCVRKPADLYEFGETVKKIENFWLLRVVRTQQAQ
jgi:CheY-like chemotaxis protein